MIVGRFVSHPWVARDLGILGAIDVVSCQAGCPARQYVPLRTGRWERGGSVPKNPGRGCAAEMLWDWSIGTKSWSGVFAIGANGFPDSDLTVLLKYCGGARRAMRAGSA